MDSPALYPSGIGCGSLNPQASSGAPLPSHDLKTESVSSMKPKEKIRPISPPTQSGKSVYFCGTNPIEGVAACRRGSGTEKCFTFQSVPLGDSKGCSPWRTFGDFPRVGKVTRGRRGGAPSPLRVWELCSHIGERRGAQPLALRQRPTSAGAKKL